MVTMFVFSLKNLISFHCLSIDSLTSKQFAQKLINDFTSQEEERVNTAGSNGCSNNVSIISKRVIQSRKSSFLIIKMMTYWTRRALANCLSVWCEMGFQIISICSTLYCRRQNILIFQFEWWCVKIAMSIVSLTHSNRNSKGRWP